MLSFYKKAALILICGFLFLFGSAAAFSQEPEADEVQEIRNTLTVMLYDLVSGRPMFYHMSRRSQDLCFESFINALKRDGKWEPFMADLKSKGINERQALPLIRKMFDQEMTDPERSKRLAVPMDLLRGVKAENCQIKVEGDHAFIKFPNAPEGRMVKESGKWKLDMSDWLRQAGGGF